MVTYDPFATTLDYKYLCEIQWDIKLAIRLHESGSTAPDIGKYQYVKDFQFLVDWVKKRYAKKKKRVRLNCDLETMGLHPYYEDKRIISISFTPKAGLAYVLYLPKSGKLTTKLQAQIDWLLNSKTTKVEGANFKFDMIWMMAKWGIMRFASFLFDTTLVGSLLDENRSNSLNMHAKIYTGMGGYDDEFNAKHDKAHMELVPKEELLLYAGGDTDAGFQVAEVMRETLVSQKRLCRFYSQLLHKSSKVFAKMEYRGMIVDRKRYAELEEECSQVMTDATARAWNLLPRRLQIKHSDNPNPTRPQIIKDFMFLGNGGLKLTPKVLTEKTKEPSTALSHLKMFQDIPEVKPYMDAIRDFCFGRLGLFRDSDSHELSPCNSLHRWLA